MAKQAMFFGLKHNSREKIRKREQNLSPPRSAPLNSAPDVRGVAAGHCGLRHGVAGADAGVQQRLEPEPLLLLAAEARQHLHVARVRARAVAGLREAMAENRGGR